MMKSAFGGFLDGFDFICSADFIRACSDFTAQSAISLKYAANCVMVKRGDEMSENKLADLSTAFAISVLKLTESIKGHYALSNQLERSGTSIGANIREAKYAHSKADFIAKLQISLKECYETEYWLELAQKANLISDDTAKSCLHDCGTLRRMLISSINTAKENMK